jgi:S1/P1 Nuclease
VGDLHQPLHTTTNDDRGGNCVPVAFFGREPEETNPNREDYRPNLHGVWDSEIIERLAHGRTPQQVAEELESRFRVQIPTWASQPVDVTTWAWESHDMAERVVFGDLPVKVAIEKPEPVSTCADDDHIAMRMLRLREQIGENYESAARPAVEEQLAKAGARLAAVLNSVWPCVSSQNEDRRPVRLFAAVTSKSTSYLRNLSSIGVAGSTCPPRNTGTEELRARCYPIYRSNPHDSIPDYVGFLSAQKGITCSTSISSANMRGGRRRL